MMVIGKDYDFDDDDDDDDDDYVLWQGWLRLASADPSAPPLIQPNYLSTEQDRW